MFADTTEGTEFRPDPQATTRTNELVRASGYSQPTVTNFLYGRRVFNSTRRNLERICIERGIKFPVEGPPSHTRGAK
jgi:hypothetical protein